MKTSYRAWACSLLVIATVLFPAVASAQEPFLSYDFEDGDLSDFLVPTGIDLCGDALPVGTAVVDGGEVTLTTDEFFGIAIMSLLPDAVVANFPESREYKVRLLLEFVEITQISVYVRGRLAADLGTGTGISAAERGYGVSLIVQGVDAEFFDGVLAISEWSGCHDLVEHPEWINGELIGSGRVPTDDSIVPGERYWIEVAAQGNDLGGPVVVSAKAWLDGDDEPGRPQIVVVDEDGLQHDETTLSPEADSQFLLGANFDIEPRPTGGTAIMDELSFTALAGCAEPPATVTRVMEGWEGRAKLEGREVALFELGGDYPVRLDISEPRNGAGECAAASEITIVERVPPGWIVDPASIVGGGEPLDEETIEWTIDPSAVDSISYVVTAGAIEQGFFSAHVFEPGSDFIVFAAGDTAAVDASGVASISDFGSIQEWLVLGPFLREVGGANPGEGEMVRDYLIDGEVDETTIRPRAGDSITPDYGGQAASTGLAPNTRGFNPGDVPTWVEWRDVDDADDRIDFESVYGALDNVMCYAVTYIDVEESTTVNFGVSSDDAVVVLLDGEPLHVNPVARGALGRSYQDTPLTHPGLGGVDLDRGQHTLLVKVFEGGGEHNFRVGFVDGDGFEIPGGPEGVSISLEPSDDPPPPIEFRRGDSNADGSVDITDGVFILNHLFLGFEGPTCADAADANDEGGLSLSSAVFILNFLFLGGGDPPPPGHLACGPDPSEDGLPECVYTLCP